MDETQTLEVRDRTDEAAPDVGQQKVQPIELRPPVGLAAGAAFGLVAAAFYTASNIALRQSVGVDPFLVTAIKAYPMVMMLAPYVLWMLISRQTIATSGKMLPRFVAASFLAHFVGNACFQFALGVIGLAAAVPITLGVIIVGGAIVARIILSEPVRPRTMLSMIVISLFSPCPWERWLHCSVLRFRQAFLQKLWSRMSDQ